MEDLKGTMVNQNRLQEDKVSLFSGSNYAIWKVRIKYYIMDVDLDVWKYLVDGRKRNKYNTKSLNSIFNELWKLNSSKMIYCETINEMWDKL